MSILEVIVVKVVMVVKEVLSSLSIVISII